VVNSLFNEYKGKYKDNIACIAIISVNFKVHLDSFKNSGITYCVKNLRRRIKSILRGDSDRNQFVFIIIIINFKKILHNKTTI
jgi:hypothetical protein